MVHSRTSRIIVLRADGTCKYEFYYQNDRYGNKFQTIGQGTWQNDEDIQIKMILNGTNQTSKFPKKKEKL